jgi:hypothetical protein
MEIEGVLNAMNHHLTSFFGCDTKLMGEEVL